MKINIKENVFKKIWILNLAIGIGSLLVIGIFLVRPPGSQEIRLRAAPASVLYFYPEEITKSPGERFTLGVMIDTHENIVPAAELHINYDPLFFKMIRLEAGPALNKLLSGPVIDNSSGEAVITICNVKNPVKRVGKIAIVQFEIIGQAEEGEKRISFSPETQASAWYAGETDILKNTQDATVFITTSTD